MMSGYRSSGGVEDLPAVDARKSQIGNQDVERKGRQALQGLLAAGGLLDYESLIREPLGDRFAERRLVIHDQQMFLAVSHLCGRTVF